MNVHITLRGFKLSRDLFSNFGNLSLGNRKRPLIFRVKWAGPSESDDNSVNAVDHDGSGCDEYSDPRGLRSETRDDDGHSWCTSRALHDVLRDADCGAHGGPHGALPYDNAAAGDGHDENDALPYALSDAGGARTLDGHGSHRVREWQWCARCNVHYEYCGALRQTRAYGNGRHDGEPHAWYAAHVRAPYG